MFLLSFFSFTLTSDITQPDVGKRIWHVLENNENFVKSVEKHINIAMPCEVANITELDTYKTKINQAISEILEFNMKIPEIIFTQKFSSSNTVVDFVNKAKSLCERLEKMESDNILANNINDVNVSNDLLKGKNILREFLSKMEIRGELVCFKNKPPFFAFKQLSEDFLQLPGVSFNFCESYTGNLREASDFTFLLRSLVFLLSQEDTFSFGVNLNESDYSFFVDGFKKFQHKIFINFEPTISPLYTPISPFPRFRYTALISCMNLMLFSSDHVLNRPYQTNPDNQGKLLKFILCEQLYDIYSEISEMIFKLSSFVYHYLKVPNPSDDKETFKLRYYEENLGILFKTYNNFFKCMFREERNDIGIREIDSVRLYYFKTSMYLNLLFFEKEYWLLLNQPGSLNPGVGSSIDYFNLSVKIAHCENIWGMILESLSQNEKIF